MIQSVLLFAVGLLLLIKGGDWFVDGATGLAHRFHLPDIIVGATVVSIGTTLPEVMVSATGAMEGLGSMAYGNAIGSVICNTSLIAAITLAVRPGTVDRKSLRMPVLFFFGAAALYCGTAYLTGYFSRPLGFVLLASEVYRYVYVSRDFWGSTMLIPIFVSSYYTNFLCTFPVNFEYYHKKTKVVSIITIVSSLINVGLNYLLILRIGMAGAAVATLISHSLQLTLHYLYVRFALGGKEYPFPLKMWVGYAAVFAAVAVASVAADGLWLARWGLGAAVGLWELLRIRKRKVLI